MPWSRDPDEGWQPERKRNVCEDCRKIILRLDDRRIEGRRVLCLECWTKGQADKERDGAG